MTDQHAPVFRIGIDVGGTFTDFVAVGGPRPVTVKVPSTPAHPADAVLTGIRQLMTSHGIAPADIASISHGTTIGLNAIVQRRIARSALVITRGFRDVLQLTQRLPEEFNLRQPHLRPLVERELIFEISARLNAAGELVVASDDAELDAVAARIRAAGVESVSLTLLHGFTAPELEGELAAQLAERLPGVPVSSSAELWPQAREYERASVGTLNAAVAPLMRAYLSSLQDGLRRLGVTAPLFITTSSGGSIGVESAMRRPVETLLSGPASGVGATIALGARHKIGRFLALDMGGTSTDISIVADGAATFAPRTEIDGIPLIMPVVDVNAVGTGGGSIAHFDGQGMLHIGPESAGAEPGPIAYGHGGTRFTLTDAFLLAGYIDAEAFGRRFGGLDLEAAARAAHEIAARIAPEAGAGAAAATGTERPEAGTESDAAARAAVDLAVSSVIELATITAGAELQKSLSRAGYRAHDFALVPFGGAGPVQGALLAEELGIRRVVVPLTAGTLCALGAAVAELRRDYLRGIPRPLDAESAARAAELLAELFAEGRAWIEEQRLPGLDAAHIALDGTLSARYRGQAYELPVPVAAEELPLPAEVIAERFHAAHESRFGYRDLSSPVELVSVQLIARGRMPVSETADSASAPAPSPAQRSDIAEHTPRTRRALFGRAWHDAEVLDETGLTDAAGTPGPAIIDLADTTVLVPPGWRIATVSSEAVILSAQEAHS